MPLVVMCGKPSVGKTYRSSQLKEYLENNHPGCKVMIISDKEDLDRNSVYADSNKEKMVRGSLKSAVDRHLSKETFVIVDSMNYIKGYRYELNCVAKYCRTTYCVIHCDASEDDIIKCNQKKPVKEQYSESIIKELLDRFEEPNPMTRWDSPFFFVHGTSDTPLPLEEICATLLGSNRQKANRSTQNPPLQSSNFVYEVDQQLQAIATAILAAQKTQELGSEVEVPGTSEKYVITSKLTIGEMRRQRKQFFNFIKANPLQDPKLVPNNFLHFLANAAV